MPLTRFLIVLTAVVTGVVLMLVIPMVQKHERQISCTQVITAAVPTRADLDRVIKDACPPEFQKQ